MKFPHIAARIFNTPLLVHPQKLDAIIAGLGGRITGRELVLDTLEATEDGIARKCSQPAAASASRRRAGQATTSSTASR
jgi:hypothetical protein